MARKRIGQRRASSARRAASRRSVTRPETVGFSRFRKVLKASGPGPNNHVFLLGFRVFDSRQLLRSVQAGLPYSAFEELVANTTIPGDAAMVLVNIPRRTLTRRKREGRFHPDESDRLLRASR